MIRIFRDLFNYADRYGTEDFHSVLERVEELEIIVSELEQKIDLLQDPEYNLHRYTLGK